MGNVVWKAKRETASINITKETEAGPVNKVFEFRCNPSDYRFIQAVREAEKLYASLGDDDSTLESVERVMEVIKKCFEIIAPGKWDAINEFADYDVNNIASLLKEAFAVIKGKVAEERMSQAAPAIPEDAPAI